MHQGVTFGGQPSGGVEVSWDGDGSTDPALPDTGGLVQKTQKSLGGVADLQGRIGAWRALLDRPLTSYYLVLGITMLLLGLGLVMVQSTASVADLSAGLSPYSDFKKQLLGAADRPAADVGRRRARRRGCSGPSPTRCSRSPSSGSASP